MKIGNKELLYSQTFLIPKGDSVSAEILLLTHPTPMSLHLDIIVDYEASDENKRNLQWKFFPEIPSWELKISGPPPALPASTSSFFAFAELNGKKIGFVAMFYGTEHLCSLHLQILVEI